MKYEISEFFPLILKKSSDFPVWQVGQIERSMHSDGILKKEFLFHQCLHRSLIVVNIFPNCQNFSFSSFNCQLLEKLKN